MRCTVRTYVKCAVVASLVAVNRPSVDQPSLLHPQLVAHRALEWMLRAIKNETEYKLIRVCTQ
jgi:hypothetical protein